MVATVVLRCCDLPPAPPPPPPLANEGAVGATSVEVELLESWQAASAAAAMVARTYNGKRVDGISLLLYWTVRRLD
jgi:hypothetical protein